MDKKCKSIEQGNTRAPGQAESTGTEVKKADNLILSNFKKVEESILPLETKKKMLSIVLDKVIPPSHDSSGDNPSDCDPKEKLSIDGNILAMCNILVMRFERVLEIVCNIFFRAVEAVEFGSLSEDTHRCIMRMKELSLITSEELWGNMIRQRIEASSPLKQERLLKFCKKILSVYIDELVYLCTAVKKRYGISSQCFDR
jgi:hypothetical protein